MSLITIKEFIKQEFDDGTTNIDISNILGISISMVSAYKLHDYNPSLDVAKRVYKTNKIVLHPFAKESLKFELENK